MGEKVETTRSRCSKCLDRVRCVRSDSDGSMLCFRNCYSGPRTRELFDIPVSSETDKAWAAGFFDGEGSVFVNHIKRSKHKDRVGCPVYPCTSPVAAIAHVRPEPLRRFCLVVGGKIRGPYKPKTERSNPYYRWEVSGRGSVCRVMSTLWPYLSHPKKEQAKRVWGELASCRGRKSPFLPPLPG